MNAVEDIDEIRNDDGTFSIEDFSELRENCSALREVFLPDEIWSQFRIWHIRPVNIAAHCSILLLAYRRGCLGQVTTPIHRYIASSSGILPSVRKQYAKDLRERWMFPAEAVERNVLARTFRGRLVELQLAVWLENHSHKIVGLEATREGPDIETFSPEGKLTAFEVKFIGVENTDFTTQIESMAGHPSAEWVSPYTAINYLLFRTYEAAHQLLSVSANKEIIVVIDDQSWWRFELQLDDDWINWDNPTFLPDQEWTDFLNRQQSKYPHLPNDLAAALGAIDSLKILRQKSNFDFLLTHTPLPRP